MHSKYLLALTFSSIACATPEKIGHTELTPPPPGYTFRGDELSKYATNPAEGHPDYGTSNYQTEQPADEYPAYPTKRLSNTIETYPVTHAEATTLPDHHVSPAETGPSVYDVSPSVTTSPSITPTHTPSTTPCISLNASSPGYTTPPQSPPIESGNGAPRFTRSLVTGFAGIIGAMVFAFVL